MAGASGVSIPTIKRLKSAEGEPGGRPDTIAKIGAALMAAGVELITENGDGLGVRLRKGAKGDPDASLRVDDLNVENDE